MILDLLAKLLFFQINLDLFSTWEPFPLCQFCRGGYFYYWIEYSAEFLERAFKNLINSIVQFQFSAGAVVYSMLNSLQIGEWTGISCMSICCKLVQELGQTSQQISLKTRCSPEVLISILHRILSSNTVVHHYLGNILPKSKISKQWVHLENSFH